jgi:catechol 2,3-dioxygenase-like lactoylglutathione lyase family enzyme
MSDQPIPHAHVGTIMLDCIDLEAMVAFWTRALGLEEKVRFHGYVWLSRISDGGPSLAFQQVPEEKLNKNRMHFDLSSPDPEAFMEGVERLGGKRLQVHESDGFTWTVCADPEGNEFCVTAEH